MDYYVLNQSGRKAIQTLEKAGRNEEAKILELLDRAGSATQEQLVYSLGMESYRVDAILKSFLSSRWIWKNTTRATSF
jgi:hypothetical protein